MFSKSFLEDMQEELINTIGLALPDLKDKRSYAGTCKQVHAFFQPVCNKYLVKYLLQAIANDGTWKNIDSKTNRPLYVNNKNILKTILDERPWLIFEKPQGNTVIEKEIFTQNVQKLQVNESPLTTALILGKLGMVKLMLTYLDKIEDGKAKALLHWKNPSNDQKKNYKAKINQLIQSIRQDASTEKVFAMLEPILNELRGDTHPIKLDNNFDAAQLLITGYNARPNDFNMQQLGAYAYILSIIKNSLPKEMYEFFTKRKAFMDAAEIINNHPLCQEFISFIEQRQIQLEEIKNTLLIDAFYKIYQDEYLPFTSQCQMGF
ncbi:MAG: hypothetical protein H0U70_07770 [Tatlockia sp.]|nr:hypothetical protein [Tatlockia sp.]